MVLHTVLLGVTVAILAYSECEMIRDEVRPVVETDLQLTAADSDAGNWTANLGDIEVRQQQTDGFQNNISELIQIRIPQDSVGNEGEELLNCFTLWLEYIVNMVIEFRFMKKIGNCFDFCALIDMCHVTFHVLYCQGWYKAAANLRLHGASTFGRPRKKFFVFQILCQTHFIYTKHAHGSTGIFMSGPGVSRLRMP